MAKDTPSIDHLLYAYDLIIFDKSILEETKNIKEILNEHCEPTGQKGNYDKSKIFFRKWIHHKHIKFLKSILKESYMSNKEKYLILLFYCQILRLMISLF